MKNMWILFAVFLTLSIALDLSHSIFVSAGYEIPSLKVLGWGFFLVSLICLAFVPDKNKSNLKFDDRKRSDSKDKD